MDGRMLADALACQACNLSSLTAAFFPTYVWRFRMRVAHRLALQRREEEEGGDLRPILRQELASFAPPCDGVRLLILLPLHTRSFLDCRSQGRRLALRDATMDAV